MTPTELSDHDVTALLEVAAADVSTEGVVAAVVERTAARRRARVRRRRASATGIAASVTLVAVGLVAWAADGDGTVDVAVPSSRPVGATTTTPLGDARSRAGEEVRREAVPGDGDSVTPLASGPGGFWLVRGSSSGDFGSGQRTISRWSTDGVRGPITFVEGIPTLALLALDRLWVVVAEPAEQGAPEWRLKEIRPKDGLLLSSTAIPLTATPTGLSIGTAGSGSSLAIATESETVVVDVGDRSVVSTPQAGRTPVQAPAVALPPAFSIEGTDLVERKEAS